MINKPMRILKIEEVQKMLMQNGHNLWTQNRIGNAKAENNTAGITPSWRGN
jgi:hypothetical protein